ncbi:GDP-mannose 4,6-dehydratase [Methylococcus mesophilus]|uniref:GDP-mannose 4,6-dehydratase n=1 Tax=Methylococcus mesophilus TaxID=2993564 RepID=UPI00224AE596|nr:GDP-mannose 4,6-dehydratase [Methylococcus mesophilus]UZR28746.1 GDP-mannose 4,6-dehydratase [Methylococcus mesophilus]
MTKIALITGVTGQDGAYLTQLLLEKGYRVFGAFRRTSSANFWRLEALGLLDHPELKLCEFDLTDPGGGLRLIEHTQPAEVYNLAAQSFVKVSFDQPVTTAQITGLGALHLLEAIRTVNPGIRYYQASTSEMFGEVQEIPQTEMTKFHPRSPYGTAKLFAHWTTINYRESYGIFGCSGILFNHESPLRGLEFVTRKITDGVARIALGSSQCLALGNLDARRDWGYAPEYVEGMYRMMQHAVPETFVLATGLTASIRDFVELAFQAVDIALEWHGKGEEEYAVDSASGVVRVRVHPDHYRPCEVEFLQGDASKAASELGWKPEVTLEHLCRLMVEDDLRRVQCGTSF